MIKITCKAKNGLPIALVKKMNKISCRVRIDNKEGYIIVDNYTDENVIEEILDIVNIHYVISAVDIDNTEADINIQKNEHSYNNESSDEKVTYMEPQNEDDLIIKKVEFKNEYIEEIVNKLLKTIYWAMYKENVDEKEIGEYLWTSINEMSMKYSRPNVIEFSVGDVVSCNYGTHLYGEINGKHVAAVVANIAANGMAYLVPITKAVEGITSHSYMPITKKKDIMYDKEEFIGTLLLDKSKYVRSERITKVIGKTDEEFFKEVLVNLSKTFDFTKNIILNTSAKNEQKDIPQIVEESVNYHGDEVLDDVNSKSIIKKLGKEEVALREIVGEKLKQLGNDRPNEKKVKNFLTEIEMIKEKCENSQKTMQEIVIESFLISCDLTKINYENIISKLKNEKFKTVKEEIIKSYMRSAFKNWIDNYPDIVAACPKISMISLLKVFAKQFSNN